jgi:nucleoside recognition membrane protein YjiH
MKTRSEIWRSPFRLDGVWFKISGQTCLVVLVMLPRLDKLKRIYYTKQELKVDQIGERKGYLLFSFPNCQTATLAER